MQLVKYTLCNIELMMVDIKGTLYCSTKQVEDIFRCERGSLMNIANQRYKEDFSDTRLSDVELQGVTKDDISKALNTRFQKNTRIWSEDDVLEFAYHVKSGFSRQCRREFKEVLKQHARRETVSRDMYDQLMRQHAEVINQIPVLQEAIEELRENQKNMASHAGASLRLVRGGGKA